MEGYTRVLKTLLPFEKVVADLTIKARELSGFGSLSETIQGMNSEEKKSGKIPIYCDLIQAHLL